MFKVITFIILVFLNAHQVHAQNKIADSCVVQPKAMNCYNLIIFYSRYWIADSLARTGFRNLIGTELLSSCDCMEGRNWKEVSKYLGKPNFVVKGSEFSEKNATLYRYMIYSYVDLKKYKSRTEYSGPGNKRLDIVVKDGVIVSFGVFENDG
jgi:hypothetical protein